MQEIRNRVLSSGSEFSDSGEEDDEKSLDEAHIQQIFNLKNQFLQTETKKDEGELGSLKRAYQEQLDAIKAKSQMQIEKISQEKENLKAELEQRYEQIIQQERQSILVSQSNQNSLTQENNQKELQAQIAKLNEKVKDQAANNEQLRVKNTEKMHECNILKNKLENEQYINSQQKEELLKYKVQIGAMENQIGLLQNEIKQKELTMKEHENVFTEQISRGREKSLKQDESIAELQERLNALQLSVNLNETQKQNNLKKFQKLESEKDQIEQKNKDLNADIHALKQTIQNQQQAFLEKEQEWKEQQSLGEDYRQSTCSLETKLRALELEIIDHKKEINTLTNEKGEVHQIISQINDIIFNAFGVQNEIQSTRKIDILLETSQTLSLTEKLRDDKYALEDQLMEIRSSIVQLELEKNQLEYEIGDALKQKEDLIIEHDKQVFELKKLLAQDQANIQEINATNNKLSIQISEKEQLIVTLENQLSEKNIECKQLQAKVNLYEKDFEQIQQKTEEDQKSKRDQLIQLMKKQSDDQVSSIQKENLQKQKQRISQKYYQTKVEDEIRKLREEKLKSIEDLENNLTFKMNDSLVKQENIFKQIQQELENQLKEKDTLIQIEQNLNKKLKEELQLNENSGTGETKKYKEKINQLEKELSEQTKQKNQLIASLNKAQKELDEWIQKSGQNVTEQEHQNLKKENEKLHQMIDRLTEQLVQTEEIAQSEQRQSVQTKAQIENLIKEKEKIAQRFQSQIDAESKVKDLNNQIMEVKQELKIQQVAFEEQKAEKMKLNKIIDNLKEEIDELSNKIKAKENEVKDVNKLYVEVLQFQTERQQSQAQMVKNYQQKVDDIKSEMQIKDAQIIKYREQLIDLQRELSDYRINGIQPNREGSVAFSQSDVLSQGLGFNPRTSLRYQSRQPKPIINEVIFEKPLETSIAEEQGKPKAVVVLIRDSSQYEKFQSKLEELNTKIVERLTVYQGMIKDKQRTQTKQSIQNDLQTFKQEFLKAFDIANITEEQKLSIQQGCLIQIKYSDSKSQNELTSKLQKIQSFIDSFSQFNPNPNDKSVESTSKTSVAKSKLSKSFKVLLQQIENLMSKEQIQELQQSFSEIQNNKDNQNAVQKFLDSVEGALKSKLSDQSLSQQQFELILEQIKKITKLIEYIRKHPE